MKRVRGDRSQSPAQPSAQSPEPKPPAPPTQPNPPRQPQPCPAQPSQRQPRPQLTPKITNEKQKAKPVQNFRSKPRTQTLYNFYKPLKCGLYHRPVGLQTPEKSSGILSHKVWSLSFGFLCSLSSQIQSGGSFRNVLL